MKPKRHPQITNLEEIEPREFGKGQFSIRSKGLGIAAAAKNLGCGWFELAPGKTSFPFHFHTGIEESLYILKGKGSLRIGNETHAVGENDYIAFPPGPDHAHTLINTGDEPLQYLAFSTKSHVDVVGYPDSKKFALTATPILNEWPPKNAWVRMIIKDQPSVDYFEGEA